MATWLISGTGLQDFYQRLQEVASPVRDGDGHVPAGVISNDSPDAYLSSDDMARWLKKHSAKERSGLYFVAQENDGREVRHSDLAELSILYSYLTTLDLTDGDFDGRIQDLPASVEVPVNVDELAEFAAVYRRAVFEVLITNRKEERGSATAWIREKEKIGEGKWRYYLITNAHVVDSLKSEQVDYRVRSVSGEVYKAEVIGADHAHDVGVLTFVAGVELPILPITLSLPAVGERIAEIGNQESEGIVYTPGVVNNISDFSSGMAMPVIHYDSNSSRGNSGSPVFNTRGEVVGIDFAGDPNDMGASIGYAVPMSVVEESYQQLRASGKYEDGGRLEASYQILSAHELSILGIDAPVGYYVRSVVIGSRAERAGLEAGHIIIAVDGGVLPHKWQRFEYELSRKPAGHEMMLDVVTIGEPDKKMTLKYVIDKRSAPNRPSWDTPFGFTVVEMDRETEEELAQTGGSGISGKTRGVLVSITSPRGRCLAEGSEFSSIGIRDGMVIEAVGNIPVNSVEEFYEAIRNELTTKKAPIVLELIATTRSGPYAGFRFTCLINGTEKRQQDRNKELGITYIELDETEKKALGVASDLKAFYITKVEGRVIGADQEQFFEGDVIIGYNEEPLAGQRNYAEVPILTYPLFKFFKRLVVIPLLRTKTFDGFIGSAAKDTKYSLRVLRNGRIVDVRRVVGGLSYPKPLSGREWASSDSVLAYSLNDEQKKRLHLDENISGVYITVREFRGAPVHPYRLESGMVVTMINGKPVKGPKDFYEKLGEVAAQGKPIVFGLAGNIQWRFPGYNSFLIADPF